MEHEKKVILLVDDDEDFCILTAKRISSAGYQVPWSTKASGIKGLIDRIKPSALLLDIQLRDAEGLDVLQEVKKSHPDLPVIILTGYETVATAVLAMKEGAFDYLSKPVEFPKLKMVLSAALQKRRLEREETKTMIKFPIPTGVPLEEACGELKEAVEKRLIEQTLSKTRWHRGKAASLLGIDPKTLYNKMRVYGIRSR